jgi:hypothetical protein
VTASQRPGCAVGASGNARSPEIAHSFAGRSDTAQPGGQCVTSASSKASNNARATSSIPGARIGIRSRKRLTQWADGTISAASGWPLRAVPTCIRPA